MKHYINIWDDVVNCTNIMVHTSYAEACASAKQVSKDKGWRGVLEIDCGKIRVLARPPEIAPSAVLHEFYLTDGKY